MWYFFQEIMFWIDILTKNGLRSDKYYLDIKLKSDSIILNNKRLIDESEWTNELRWSNGGKLKASEMLPVDLNAWLYYLEVTLSRIYTSSGQKEYAKSFENLAQKGRFCLMNIFGTKQKDSFSIIIFHKKTEWSLFFSRDIATICWFSRYSTSR